MTDDVGIPRLAVLDDLAERILEYAAEELDPERTTLELRGYADGDYRIRAYETRSIEEHPDLEGTAMERMAIVYDRRTEWIQFRRSYETADDRVVEDVRDLEAYPDPVLLEECDE